MCIDLQNLAKKSYEQFTFKKMNFDQEKDKGKPLNPQQYVYATNIMHEEGDKFRNGNYD